MSNGNTFSWLSFLLGFAIGLWIAVVVLFLIDDDDCGCCCRDQGGGTVVATPGSGEAWVPGGDGAYYCTNNDEGGAIIVDEGGAIIVDEGGAIIVDEGGAIIVDEGSAIIVDKGGFAPAPRNAQLGRDRDFEEYRCTTNDEGGAIIVDRANRVVVTPMPDAFASDRCVRSNGKAAVRNASDEPVIVDEGGAIVVDSGVTVSVDVEADSGDDITLPTDPQSTTNLAYCMVAEDTSDPIVARP